MESYEFDEFLEILRCAGAQNAADHSSSDFAKYKSDCDNQRNSNIVNQNNQNNERVKTNMRIIFEQFDKDNDGKIIKQELNFVMQNLFPEETITEKDIDDMLRAADLDQNGFIDFDGKSLNLIF